VSHKQQTSKISRAREGGERAVTGRATDPRIERTREALGDALIELIEEAGFEAVSVRSIAERARVNRATFYQHYRSKDDLLLRVSEAAFDGLAAEAGPIDVENLDFQEPPLQLVLLFEYLARHRSFFRAVLGKTGVSLFSTRMREYLATYIRRRIGALHALYPAATPILDDAFIGEYVAGAVMGVVIWWLESEKPHSPAYMADRFGWLSAAGAYRLLGIDPPSLEID